MQRISDDSHCGNTKRTVLVIDNDEHVNDHGTQKDNRSKHDIIQVCEKCLDTVDIRFDPRESNVMATILIPLDSVSRLARLLCSSFFFVMPGPPVVSLELRLRRS